MTGSQDFSQGDIQFQLFMTGANLSSPVTLSNNKLNMNKKNS